jgi:hypothetical protein
MKLLPRSLPYLLSWGVLAGLMIVGMTRIPTWLYGPIDGDWAEWNAEAILRFGKPFDLSPYSMLAGMGSMYAPNLPWLNPGALVLALPLSETTTSLLSYIVYAAELAVTSLVLARALGFSWLTATAAAQLHLYLLFPPFSAALYLYTWYSLVPYFAHLLAVLNLALVVLLACGRSANRWRNAALALAFVALFVIGLTSAPITFLFAAPAYIVIGGSVMIARRPVLAEWGWKLAALALCLAFFFGAGLTSYYLGMVATSGRTPAGSPAWEQLRSASAWLKLLREHELCSDPRLLLCLPERGAWLQIATLAGAAVAALTRRGDIRAVALAMIGYTGFVHLYAYAYQAGWLGPVSVLSSHFWILSSWPVMFLLAVYPFTEAPWIAVPGDKRSNAAALASVTVNAALAVLMVVIVVHLFGKPYDTFQIGAYRAYRIVTMAAVIALLALAAAAIPPRSALNALFGTASPNARLRQVAMLAFLPALAIVHLSFGARLAEPQVRDAALRDYLKAQAAIAPGAPFRGYATTIWEDKDDKIKAGPMQTLGASALYFNGRPYFESRYGETFTETDLWRLGVPTIEEYAEWTSAQAHAFFLRLLAPPGAHVHSNYLRGYVIDTEVLRAMGVRFVITDADRLDQPAPVRAALSAPGAPDVRLFELSDVNLGTYSPTRFETATTADAIADRIRANKSRLSEVAVVGEDVPAATAQARNATITVERDGIRVEAQSDGPAHLLLPVQFSHCLTVANGAAARLTRADLFLTLLSFSGKLDALLEFRFGLFADNACRLRDGADNKALGL